MFFGPGFDDVGIAAGAAAVVQVVLRTVILALHRRD
jgi:hypothetical protein